LERSCGFSEAQKAQESDSTPDPQPITIAEKSMATQIMFARLTTA
jgi:hypothetical protein